MNLKEAFRYQNKLQALIDEIDGLLSDKSHITITQCTYLRKKAMPEAEDETIEEKWDSELADHVTELTIFMFHLLSEKQVLSTAIREAKEKLPMDMDSEVSLNARRQAMVKTLRRMDAIRSSEVIVPHGGRGYRFNAEGNQVAYICDVKRVTRINFDRNQIRSTIQLLDLQIDATSAGIDSCLVNTDVAYVPTFGVNDSLQTAFETYFASVSRRGSKSQHAEQPQREND